MRALTSLITCVLLAACSPDPQGDTSAPAQEAPLESAQAEDKDDDAPEGTLVQSPNPGSPEAILQGVIAAAMYPDEAAGWKALRALLHSSIKSPRALTSYREMNYAASRRKVKLFTPDDTKPYFRVVSRSELSKDKLKLFVHNEKSMPTPCTLKRDPEAENAWRVYVCSL